MILIHRLRSIVRWTFRRQEAEQELSDELRDFIERSTSDKIVNGMSPKEADRTSRIELGGVAQVKEGVRSTRGLAWLGGFGLDVKLGLRMLRKSWGVDSGRGPGYDGRDGNWRGRLWLPSHDLLERPASGRG